MEFQGKMDKDKRKEIKSRSIESGFEMVRRYEDRNGRMRVSSS